PAESVAADLGLRVPARFAVAPAESALGAAARGFFTAEAGRARAARAAGLLAVAAVFDPALDGAVRDFARAAVFFILGSLRPGGALPQWATSVSPCPRSNEMPAAAIAIRSATWCAISTLTGRTPLEARRSITRSNCSALNAPRRRRSSRWPEASGLNDSRSCSLNTRWA